MSKDVVPLLHSLDEVYSTSARKKEQERWSNLYEGFQTRFQQKASFVARAPGRVNLIGDVFPAAIDKDILMATAYQPDEGSGILTIFLHNVSDRFAATDFQCELQDAESVKLIHEGNTRWANYFKVAIKGLLPHLPSDMKERGGTLNVLVDGSVPPESSLSSSAAMTTCSSIVVLNALGAREHIPRKEMTEVAIESERLVGVNSGGMDQAASVFGVPDHALFVSFVPKLSTEPVLLPYCKEEAFTFVISNTLKVSDKKVTGPFQYNLRVVETRLAAAVLAVALNVDANIQALKPSYRNTLRAVADAYYSTYPDSWQALLQDARIKDVYEESGKEAAQLEGMLRVVEEHLPKEGMNRAQLEEATQLYGEAFHETFLSAFPVQAELFYLYRRAKHVYSEARRVLDFKALCTRANAQKYESPDVYKRLGSLMNLSHESLRTLYECSCAELDAVVDIARKHGSLGSRLTGAGWGGCAVHLVPRNKVGSVLDALQRDYYTLHYPELDQMQLNDALFATEPARGACIV
ncbi:galactokinase [Malassezia yamatoensis]|uniref:Galactokinase n=1 Tax=Malassezia yamatoensis TaxID=253288 RepID=A0AAJ5YPN7_9BASI|nr:galactokinase [Malassezia yamatoensis]